MTYARLAEASNIRSDMVKNGNGGGNNLNDEKDGLLAILPVSAESAGFLPKRTGTCSYIFMMIQSYLQGFKLS